MPLSFDAHANFAISTVATAPSPATSGTSLALASGDGAKFPAAPFNAVIWPAAAQPTSATAEIVRVTGISTDTLTITRTQEGTSARTVVVGDQICAVLSAKTLTDVEQMFDLHTTWWDKDDFLGPNTAPSYWGKWGWSSGGTITVVAGAAGGHVGILNINTTATINTWAYLYTPNSLSFADVGDTFDFTWYARLNTNDANTIVTFGFIDTIIGAASSGIVIEKQAADTSWFGNCVTSTVSTRTTALATVDTGWHRFRVRRVDSTHIGFSVDGGTEQQIATHIPSGGLYFGVKISNTAAAAKNIDIDAVALLISGLSR